MHGEQYVWAQRVPSRAKKYQITQKFETRKTWKRRIQNKMSTGRLYGNRSIHAMHVAYVNGTDMHGWVAFGTVVRFLKRMFRSNSDFL